MCFPPADGVHGCESNEWRNPYLEAVRCKQDGRQGFPRRHFSPVSWEAASRWEHYSCLSVEKFYLTWPRAVLLAPSLRHVEGWCSRQRWCILMSCLHLFEVENGECSIVTRISLDTFTPVKLSCQSKGTKINSHQKIQCKQKKGDVGKTIPPDWTEL